MHKMSIHGGNFKASFAVSPLKVIKSSVRNAEPSAPFSLCTCSAYCMYKCLSAIRLHITIQESSTSILCL